MLTVHFLLFNYPDTIDELALEIRYGMTISDIAALCAADERVTAPAQALLDSGGIVDGMYISRDYVFQGDEQSLDFIHQLGDG